MTSNQIALRQVKEVERHNLIQEQLGFESNRITEEHYVRADHAALMNAYANQRQAAAAEMNAATNRINATTNQFNAETQRMLANNQIEYNQGMLGIQREKVAIEQQNADTNAMNALTRLKELDHKIYYDQATIQLNTREQDRKERETSLYSTEVGLKVKTFHESIRQFNIEEKRKISETKVKNRATTINTALGIGNSIVNAIGTFGKLQLGAEQNAIRLIAALE